jgi:hypothetical protein
MKNMRWVGIWLIWSEKYMQDFGGDDLKGELLEKLCIGGRIILKVMFIK